MPNTLAHLGIQTLCSKAVFSKADFKWIAVGCIIPDLPWIVQRLSHALVPAINPFDLRIYTMIQASLFFSLILSAALSLLTTQATKTFIVVGGNALLHLLLDSLQTKWANGVHLLAPFSWHQTAFNLFWPEDPISSFLSILGLLSMGVFAYHDRHTIIALTRTMMRYHVALFLFIVYALLPFAFFQGPLQTDNHYVTTLLESNQRQGKTIAVDRCSYTAKDKTIRIFSGEIFPLQGTLPDSDAKISLQGYFVDNSTIHISSYHVHTTLRDTSSKIGLTGILLVWIMAGVSRRIRLNP